MKRYTRIKNHLKEIGFHHAWGYWIFGENKNQRIVIRVTKKMIFIDMTKRSNIFNLDTDRISIRKHDMDFDISLVTKRIEEYFKK